MSEAKRIGGFMVENPNTLIVGSNEEIPKEANIIKDIYGSNGHLYFRIVEN